MSTGRPLRSFIPHILAILFAGAGCFGIALWAKDKIEAATLSDISLALSSQGHDWAEATADGLQITLTGIAPDEATRFSALSAVGSVVDASRILDQMGVEAAAQISVPDFSVEVLNNEDGISLIGIVPLESSPETIIERARQISQNAQVTDLLESADFAPPPGWERALAFGLNTLEALPRSKVSISANRVAVKAVAEDPEDKARIERTLRRDAPSGVRLDLNITSPLPVITPFTLRFLIDDRGPRFDACAADTPEARSAILAAAAAAGVPNPDRCPLGLGAPSASWSEAAVAGIDALAAIGQGTLTLSNADMTLVAAEGTPEGVFDRHIGALESNLPDVFSLRAVRLEAAEEADTAETVPEFVATRSPEGLVQLRGRVGSELTQQAVETFAAAQFGAGNIRPATRIAEDLPAGWPARVLASLESLALLHNGAAIVTPDTVEITGRTGLEYAQSEITRILSSKLEDGATFALDIAYSEDLDPLASLPSAAECIELIETAAATKKITFAPSSTDIEEDALPTIDAIAEIIRDCQSVKIEIGGHTDSQGREIMNQQLSQARADAVLNAIMARRVLVSNLTAVGYGETKPIADNDTEEGREANRRIEFKLILPEDRASADTETDGPEGGATE